MKKIIFGLILILAASAAMAVPQYLNYQGVLRDNAGNLVTGTKTMTFKIFDEATGGSEKFSMTSSEVVSNGLYTAQLGPLGLNELGSGRRWLEVTVGTETLSPRLEILAVAYAVTAASAESAAKLGSYSTAFSGPSIIPVTDTSGKLSSSVIPASGISADTAAYAILSGTASTAATALNANSVIGPVSAEASGNNYALFINGGKFGISGTIIGTEEIISGSSLVTITNSSVTSNSTIFLTVRYVGPTAGSNGNGGIRVSLIQDGAFRVATMDGLAATANIPFSYLIIN
jgi:hypothetical protein